MNLQKFNLEHKPCCWWLRSAYSDDSNFVGFVYYDGDVYSDIAYNYNGVLSACIII